MAGFIMIPVLVIFANAVGIVAGWKAAQLVLPLTDADFYYGARFFWRPFDAYYSLIKAFFFAGSITIISCYMGFNTKQGAAGDGQGDHRRRGLQLRPHPPARRPAGQDSPQTMIELKDVHKRFGEQVILDGVNFTVQDGETVALLGPSGTGKGVLLKHIIGLIRPDIGTVEVDGKLVGRLKREDLAGRSRIGYVFRTARCSTRTTCTRTSAWD